MWERSPLRSRWYIPNNKVWASIGKWSFFLQATLMYHRQPVMRWRPQMKISEIHVLPATGISQMCLLQHNEQGEECEVFDYDLKNNWSPVCLLHYWLVDPHRPFRLSFANVNLNLTWLIFCIQSALLSIYITHGHSKNLPTYCTFTYHQPQWIMAALLLSRIVWKFKMLLSFCGAFCDPYYPFWTYRQRLRKSFNLLTIATNLL